MEPTKEHRCEDCDKTFTRKNGLTRHYDSITHKRKVGIVLIKCEICNQVFLSEQTLKNHCNLDSHKKRAESLPADGILETPSFICKQDGCNTRSSYGKEGSFIKEYCKPHAPKDYVNVVTKRCKEENCNLIPSYGKEGSRSKEYCKEHAPVGYVTIASKKCKHENCDIIPIYGHPDSNLIEYCSSHAPDGYIDVVHKKCKDENCNIRPNFGKEGSTLAEYCKEHAPKEYVDVTHKKCKQENCNIQPHYGPQGSNLKEYCAAHRPIGYVDVANKKCIHENCGILSSYGRPGSNLKEYCVRHKPDDYVDLAHKTCIDENCNIRPIYGKQGSMLAEYCKLHAPDGYIDVTHEKCKHENCDIRAGYGKKGSKLAEYCKRHIPDDYIDVAHSICEYENCEVRSSYGFPSLKITKNCTNNVLNELNTLNKPTHCASHKRAGMIFIRKCTVETCNNSALYGVKIPIYCEEHKKSNDIDLTVRKCNQCFYIGAVDSNGLCWDNCVATTIYNKEYKKYQTAKQNKVGALLRKEIDFEIFCTDKVIDSACGLRRPDFVYNVGPHIVIVEVDENAGDDSSYHKNYEEERIRMFEISTYFETRPLIFIRYNPDNYHVAGKLKKTPINQRELILLKWVDKALSHDIFPQNEKNVCPTVLTVYLYYDEYYEGISDFMELKQYGLTNGLKPCSS
jgi:hypothetical protein